MVCEKGVDLPVSSSVFNQYLASNKSQLTRQVENAKNHAMLDIGTGIVDTATSIATAMAGGWKQLMVSKAKIGEGRYDDPTQGRGPGWTYANRGKVWASDMVNNPHVNYGFHNMNAGINTAGHGFVNYQTATHDALAMLTDFYHAPRNITMSSSDALFSFAKSDKKVVIQRFWITDYYKKKLADYWALYGYKQNKLIDLSGGKLTRRRFYTYVKAIDMQLSGNNIEKEEIDAMKKIFNNGITFWYYPRLKEAGIEMYDYTLDNKEMYS